MDATNRIEQALVAAIAAGEMPAVDRGAADRPECPPRLAAAIRYAVFPRGARIRPRLCLAVAAACGEDFSVVSDAAAASIELLHCASLVHDDLPCFDDAETRRGKASLHKAYGEPLAVLAGDALIVLSFQNLARAAAYAPDRLAALLRTLAAAASTPSGIVAGQAWECEPQVNLSQYHRAKTGALFAAATLSGAIAAGAQPAPWRMLGEALGEAFQLADDIKDAVEDSAEIGKPVGRDAALGRPNGVASLGIDGATGALKLLVEEALDSIPLCPGIADLRAIILTETRRLLPKDLSRRAA
jgi:geranylgeranyl diphosphate synthase type II